MTESNCFNFALIIIFILLLLLNLFIRKPKKYKNLPPTPPSLPIIGHLHLLKEPLYQTLHAFSQKYGPVIRLRFGVRNVLVVASPSAVEECFTKNDIVFANRPRLILEKHLNYNYTTIGAAPYGHLWRTLRRVSTLELFSPARLAATASVRQNVVALLAGQIVKSCGGNGSGRVNLKARFGEVSINTISALMMGRRYYGDDVADQAAAGQFRVLMREFLVLLKISNVGDYLPFLRWLDFQGMERRMVALMEKMDKFLQGIVDEYRRNLCSVGKVDGSRGPEKMTMVDNLLVLQQKEPDFYTDDIIKGLIMIMLIAGTESSFTTMEWAMSLLLNHPTAMQKVKSEIDTHVGHHRPLQEEDLPNLNYLKNVITETLRLYPAVPLLVPHQASDDCTVGGYDVARGTMLLVNAWTMHRDPNLWVNPTKFVPERFEGLEERKGGGYEMIPFGTGRRGCPGAGLANKMVGLVLGTLIQAFEWERVGAEEVDMAASSGISLGKFKPLEAICRPRPTMIHHFI